MMNGRLCCPNHSFLRMLKPYETLPDLCSHGLFLMFPWSSTQSFVLRIVVTGILPRQVERQSNLMEGLRLKPIELPILVGDLGYLLLTLLTNLGCQPFLPTLHTNVSYQR